MHVALFGLLRGLWTDLLTASEAAVAVQYHAPWNRSAGTIAASAKRVGTKMAPDHIAGARVCGA